MKIFELVHDDLVPAPLKTYADSILFYEFGRSAPQGKLFEIGVGGSTYLMLQLAEDLDVPFYLCDVDQSKIDEYMKWQHHWHCAEIHILNEDSDEIELNEKFVYLHLDGSHTYNKTINSINWSINHLKENGLICIDDYGNNKHPEVTRATHDLIQQNIVKMIMVGDSSCWVTTPEYYEHWLNVIENKMTGYIKDLLGISWVKPGKYYYRQAHHAKPVETELHNYNSNRYLQMPYPEQTDIMR